MKTIHLLSLAAILLLATTPAHAQYPTSGKPVPQLSFLDDIIHTYMDTTDAVGVVVGVSHAGEMVFWRGYGWSDLDLTVPMQESAAFRVASITKTFTAAVIVDLAELDLLSLDDHAFDLGQAGGGILDLEPFPSLGDPNLEDVTVRHLLLHEAGWDREIAGDLTGQESELVIQEDMGLPELPTIRETMRWILGQELQWTPGDTSVYSNQGYLALGLIAEQVSGTDLLSYIRNHLLTDDLWFPADDLIMGRSLLPQLDPREPHYHFTGLWTNVFDPDGDPVPAPYGGWNHEIKDGYGRMVANAIPLLHLAHRYYLNGNGRGRPIGDVHERAQHGGALWGTNSLLRQRNDGVDFVVMVNSYDGHKIHGREIRTLLDEAFDSATIQWPTETVDCVWFDFDHAGQELGSFDFPYGSVNDLGNVAAYSKVRIKPGSSPWTGVITRGHLALSGTEGGSVVIGQ